MTTYFAPSTLEEAVAYLQANQTIKIIAGGTDLLVAHYQELDTLPGLMDIGNIAELKTIATGEEVEIGALVTHEDIARHPWLQQHVPFLSQGAAQVGGPQIRNRGTIGGNLVHASPAADGAPPLIVLGAVVELTGSAPVQVPLEEFFIGPGKTVLAPDQILTKVKFSKPAANQGGAFLKLGKRKAMAIATASVAVLVTVDNNCLTDLRICLGSVGPVPLRARKTEDVLRGQKVDLLDLAAAEKKLQEEISPIDDIRGSAEYRRQAAGALLRRALQQAINNVGVTQND
ncbi:MAG: FAD binding domain-containing protein [Bacillota bacterium]|jgi:CO/xanthine dehydrogenase FAD-binding subunit|nr:xanthine dehydrogenase family protein subunit M [Bacillota bacterium]HOC06969.1 xanthine dehydrogenase family protein subunit M [Bacillota bacterium]HPZ22601.1 xanthine dehydrogenase family protein subunit M [Bacillota bacterium]HQD20360.1 xanthine dehydrogenase family protein subunit M [Bacillota bacterium]